MSPVNCRVVTSYRLLQGGGQVASKLSHIWPPPLFSCKCRQQGFLVLMPLELGIRLTSCWCWEGGHGSCSAQHLHCRLVQCGCHMLPSSLGHAGRHLESCNCQSDNKARICGACKSSHDQHWCSSPADRVSGNDPTSASSESFPNTSRLRKPSTQTSSGISPIPALCPAAAVTLFLITANLL